jgi:hypothetical protein
MEKQYEEDHNQGLRIDPERVRLLSFRLLTIYLASKELNSLRDGEYDSGPDVLSQYERPEIEHLLLQIAILCRTADDNAIAGKTLYDRYNPIVGKLYPDISKPEFTKLGLREACNKIIHQEKVNYEVVEGEYKWNRYLEPTLYIYGTQNNTKWKAELDVKEFCYGVCHLPE